MSNIIPKLFMNSDGGYRVRAIEQNNEPWFVAVDVCNNIGLTNPTESVKVLDDDERSTLRISEGGPEVNIISEAGLYSLILRSNKPEAKNFKRWITHEVIPSIRKLGAYIAGPGHIDSKFLFQIAAQLEEKEKQIALMVPKAQSYDVLMDAVGCLTMNEAAKILDIKGIGQNNFFKILSLERIIYKKGDIYLPMQEFKSHFIVKQNPIKRGDTIVERSQLFLSTQGLDWLAHKLIDKGYQINYYKGKPA
jgi:prophage antirepressor-like protein